MITVHESRTLESQEMLYEISVLCASGCQNQVGFSNHLEMDAVILPL